MFGQHATWRHGRPARADRTPTRLDVSCWSSGGLRCRRGCPRWWWCRAAPRAGSPRLGGTTRLQADPPPTERLARMGRELRRFRVPRRLVIAVLLAAVLLAASTLAGCSTATGPSVRPATSAAATASTELAPHRPTPATTASGPATNQGLPAAGAPGSRTARYVFPVRGCRASYGHGHPYYPATDIFTDRGCRFVAPPGGRVNEVRRGDRWDTSSDRGADRGGLSVSVIGMDGVRYYGSHLQSIAPGIVPGARVRAGSSWAASTTPATPA